MTLLPRRLTLTKEMSPEQIAHTMNEWMRDTHDALRIALARDFAHRIRPTEVQIGNYTARPWDACLMDASRGPMTVHLPDARPDTARASMILVLNISVSTDTITVQPSGPGQKINGEAKHTINIPHGCRLFYSNGQHWFTLSDLGGDETLITPAASALLWEWNGTDTSQFESSDAYAGASWVTTLSVETDTAVPGGSVLRYEWTSGGSGGDSATRLILASEFTAPASLRYVVEVVQADISTSNRYGGVSFFCDPNAGSLYGFGHAWGASGKQLRWENGVYTASSTTGLGNLIGVDDGYAQLTIQGDKASGVEPRFVCYGQGAESNAARATYFRQDDFASASGGTATGVSPTRAGIALYAPGGTSPAFHWDIAAFRIWKHPRDL